MLAVAQRSVGLLGLRVAASRGAMSMSTAAAWKAESATDATFEKEVIKAPGLVVVDFYADWCGPCKMLDPVLQTSAKERNVRLVKVDCDENVETASQYGISALPTVVAFRDGQKVGEFMGLRPAMFINSFIDQHKK